MGPKRSALPPAQKRKTARSQTDSEEDVNMTAAEIVVATAPSPTSLQDSETSRDSSETVEDSLEILSHDVRQLIDAVTKLERLGIDSNIPVPKVVVVGDQSAGKSSLIEAMSEISVPRNSGTCTRCPIQITTNADEGPWKCIVSLVSRYLYPGEQSSTSEVGPFHPWIESRQPSTSVFKIVYNKSELCDIIWRAQIAILNPSQEPSRFLKARLSHNTESNIQVQFSPNYISLDITGPALPSLSFYDLPGVITHPEQDDDEYLVPLVYNLAKSYIEDENCLVLLACSMESDIHTSSAAALVRKAGAADRCVGVLTKPDRVPTGHPFDIWAAILSGTKFAVRHGYFVTKQPAQDQLDKKEHTHRQARLHEDCFFENTQPWAGKLSHFKARFGTKRLQQALSRKLAHQISASLPRIQEQLVARLANVKDELAARPVVAPHNAFNIVRMSVTDFIDDVQQFIKGEYPYNSFRTAWKSHKKLFRDDLREALPKFNPSTSESNHIIALDDDDHDEGTPCPLPSPVTPKKRKLEIESETENVLMATPMTKTSTATSSTMPAKSPTFAGPMSIDQLRSFLENWNVSGRKRTYDPKAVDYLIQEGMQRWDKPSEVFGRKVKKMLTQTLNKSFHKAFGAWQDTELYRVAWNATQRFLDETFGKHVSFAETALKHETVVPPSTEYDDALEKERHGILLKLKEARFQRRAKAQLQAEAQDGKKQLDNLDAKVRKERNRLQEVLGEDPAQREIDIMAEIRSYHILASMRYLDNVCRSVEVEVFEHLRASGLRDALETALLRSDGAVEERCQELLAEDQHRAQRRRELQEEKQHLQEAELILQGLEEKHSE